MMIISFIHYESLNFNKEMILSQVFRWSRFFCYLRMGANGHFKMISNQIVLHHIA